MTASDLLRYKLRQLQSDASEDEVVALMLTLTTDPKTVLTSIQAELTTFKQTQLTNLTVTQTQLLADLGDLGKLSFAPQ